MATILVVEDDVAICNLLRNHLEADGYMVIQAFDGPTALVAVEQHQPHLIILDWMLPGMDGLAVCRRLNSQVPQAIDTLSRESPPELSPTAPPPLVRGPLHIHLAERSVRLDGQEIDLTPKEYDLLVLLASHPGWVFKREVLLQQVWGDEYEGFDRTIDNHMMRLRKKLGLVGEKIETVWGVGYRFLQ